MRWRSQARKAARPAQPPQGLPAGCIPSRVTGSGPLGPCPGPLVPAWPGVLYRTIPEANLGCSNKSAGPPRNQESKKNLLEFSTGPSRTECHPLRGWGRAGGCGWHSPQESAT